MPTKNPGQENPPAKKRSGPTAEQKGYSTSEAIIELCDTLIGENDANRKQQSREPKRKPSWVEIATLLLLFSTTFGLAVQDGILYSSDTTFKATLDTQKQSNERQLRAYVGISPGDVEDFGIPNKWHVRFVRKNYGQTPAYEVGFSKVGFSIIKENQPINTGDFACGRPVIGGLFTMFPTTELPWNVNVADTKFLNAEELQLVKSGDRRFVYWGTICYRDTFGKFHYTNYCWMYKGSSMTAKDADGCLTHNDSD